MKIGITCYPTCGGSGIVATELGLELARRGHEVHFITYANPIRLDTDRRGIHYHEVEVSTYPLFQYPPYCLALASRMAEVAEQYQLDLLHVHYAIPHSISALLARQMTAKLRRLPFVTTLHGTDITLVGSDPSYAQVVAFSIAQSHGVTAVSESLKQQTIESLGIDRQIRVIPNFLDCSSYRREPDAARRARLRRGDTEALVLHVSNFRPVKRVELVVDIFRRIRDRIRARLVMVGDGPDRLAAERRVAELNLSDAVEFVGDQLDLVSWLSAADLLLLPSSQESFGLAALEAMACEVVVVASRVGGLPEVIEDGVTGFLCDPDDLEAMAERGVAVLLDPDRRLAMGRAAARLVRAKYCTDAIVPQYEAYYREVAEAVPTDQPAVVRSN